MGLSFVVGSKVSKAPYDLAEYTHFHGDAYQDGQLIETTTPKKGARSCPTGATRARNRLPWEPEGGPASWRVLWQYSARRFSHDNATLTAQENKARAVVDGEMAVRRPRFVKGSRNSISPRRGVPQTRPRGRRA
ncbi:hypothetical protein [Actinomyces sp.]|uniref:hypothetical protein n=1 Tax=Actinomyces sp. TaxID=29317 RepID=UPI0026DB3E4C|nr:hypothetical protein [Actinomyces sp.]MDO4901742.1 hypothetical protein [Actinomyces sp.]